MIKDTDNTITIYMSTFNGEKYIEDQINSILSQKHVIFKLFIRDDGSSDTTLKILKKYSRKYDNIFVTEGKNIGVGKSFMTLMLENKCESMYYAYADQDDLWDEDKLICGIEKIRKSKDKIGPKLYVSNQRCITKNGKYISNRFPDDFPVQNLGNIIFSNLYSGCSMIFNRDLYNILLDHNRIPYIDFFDHRIHDAWTACVASLFYPIIFDSSCHMSFRRHGSNVSESEIIRYKNVSFFERLKIFLKKVDRIAKFKNLKIRGCELTAINLLKYYGEYIENDDKYLLKIIAEYRNFPKLKIRLLFGDYVRKFSPESKIYIYLKILIGIL